MAKIKMQIPDNSRSGRRRLVGSTGGIGVKDSSSSTRYPLSGTARQPITKSEKYAGSGANVVFTQPMFFSPLHTPQNWQIASKRREIYQWSRFYYENEPKVAAGVDFYCFEPSTPILLADGAQKSISSIKTGDLVRSHDGSVNTVLKTHSRTANEKMLKISIAGVSQGPLKVTPNHTMFIMKNENLQEIPAEDLKVGDWLVSPCSYEENEISNINKNCKVDGKYILRKIRSIKSYNYSGLVYDLTIKNAHSYIANRVACHNSNFPMNGFSLECSDSNVLDYFEEVSERLDLNEWLNYISHEYYLLGDVFPFLEISCPQCGGTQIDPDTGEVCNHPGGTIKSIRILNPDYVEVQDNVLADEPIISLMPDEELKMIIQRKQPKQIYDKLAGWLIDLVASGRPIPLSNRSVSHIKHNASPYGTYGSSMLRRLFTMLAYKTKIMTANWIIAERLILPIRVVKIGDKDRPATEEDIQDVVNQLAAVANDPNLTIVTHHAFEYEWFGAAGKIHQISKEIDTIGKELLDGMMLNQAILNGEAAGYNCFDDKTLCLTDSGFKNHNDVTEKDKIGCYNPETKTMEYHPYLQKHVYDFDGDLVHFQTNKIDIAVTPNHRMWSAKRDSDDFRFIEAKDVKKRARFVGIVDDFDGESISEVNIGEQSIPIYQYCELAGFYVSEGCVANEKRKNRKNETTTIVVYQSLNSKYRKQIESIFEDSFENHYCRKDAICSFNPEIANHFENQYGRGSSNKKLPSWIKNLSTEYLEILLQSLIAGDGHQKSDDRYSAYYTVSEQLSLDVAEIAFKCGYAVQITKKLARGKTGYFNKTGHEFNNTKDIYIVYISKGNKGRYPGLDSRDKKYAGKEIEKMPYKGKVWCFTVPHGLFVTMRNGKVTVQGNSAQVGVEIMIRRLENWRTRLKDWVEKRIFLPIAMMQGFVDEKRSKRLKRTVYLYPQIKWNEMNLRDNSNKVQILLQMYDKGMVSAQTICGEMSLDYDGEVEKLRQEQMVVSAAGLMAGGQAGAPGGMGGAMGGAMGGMPPPPGGDMMGGEMGGMDAGAGGAPGMMPVGGPEPGMAAASAPPRITKKGKGGQQQEQQVPQNKMLKLTKLEATMYNSLQQMGVPYKLFGQYEINMPGQDQPFVLDFAFPEIGVGIETDGAIWHERADFEQRDSERDQKLSNVGWRILRFSEEAVYEHMSTIQDIIKTNLKEASKDLKKAAEQSDGEGLIKLAHLRSKAFIKKTASELELELENMTGNNLGYIIKLGT